MTVQPLPDQRRTMERAALDLAARGYHVFPCREGEKTPLTQHGFKDATTDERQILRWWDAHPTANIGIACGASGLTVLDIDAKHGADPTEVLRGRDLHGAPLVVTGRAASDATAGPADAAAPRGAHVYFRGALPTGPIPRLPGCEIRGAGAYVIAPPSLHPSGVHYQGALPRVGDLPAAPEWLTELAARGGGSGHAAAPPAEETIPAGDRNARLASLAGSMRRRGLDADEIAAALQVTNRKRCRPPLDADEVDRIAASVARYKPADAADAASTVGFRPLARTSNADAAEAMRALTELLALDTVNTAVTAARVFGRGSGASLELELSNGETMTFSTLREMMRPQALIAEVAACTGATPLVKQVQCAQALTLARAAAEYVETDTENDIAREWGRDFLQIAEVLDLDLGDQAQRWGAFELLAGRDPWGQRRETGDSTTGTPLVLRHEDGTRYVRTVWFERYVKTRDASVSRTAIGPRMARVGWGRRGKHGDIKATCPGRPETKTFPFWVVVAGWEEGE